ncbi:hypothetical protein FQZ97_1005760 [compost metagenome]
MMAWVSGVVRVIPQSICGVVILSVIKENGTGSSSADCISRLCQSIVRPSRRGGVPVLSRPTAKPRPRKVSESPSAGFSPMRPAGIFFSPIWIRPFRNVPVVNTTAAQESSRPSPRTTPEMFPSVMRMSEAPPSTTVRFSCSEMSSCIASR